MTDTENKKSEKNTISLYWKCQLIGWCFVSIHWGYIVFTRDNYGITHTIFNYLIDVSTGILLTHIYRAISLRSNKNHTDLKKLLLKIIPSIIILAFIYMLLANFKWHYYWVLIRGKELSILNSLFEWNPVFTTGIRLMSIWLLAYHLYHYYTNQIKITQVNARLSIIAKQAQLDNLSAQLNPHFLFNSLNSIKSLVIENPKTARRAIDLLSDLLRSSIYEKEENLTSIKNELSLVKDYIELEKLRFEERLQLHLNMDTSIEMYKVPTLSIQLLVENAIKHSIDQSIKGGIITLSIKKIGDSIQISVVNSGKLTSTNKNKGLGLTNLKERLEIQYKGNANFTLKEDSEKNNITATITLPITDNENI